MTERRKAPIPVSEVGFPGMGHEESGLLFTEIQEPIRKGDAEGLARVLEGNMVDAALTEIDSLRGDRRDVGADRETPQNLSHS